MITRVMIWAFVALLLAGGAVSAQDAEVKRMILQRTDVPGTVYECIMGMAELPPGSSIGRHTHYGVEVGYIAAGEMDLVVEGEETRRVRAGDSYTIPAGKAHDARNVGTVPGTAMATWVVEKGKPLSEAAP